MATGAGPTLAQEADPFPQFTFKRVKPPSSGNSRKRITIQITPEDLARQRAAPRPKPKAEATKTAAAAPAKPKSKEAYAWYWESVSPLMSESGPGRLESALNRLGNGPGGATVKSPRLQSLADIARAQGTAILLSTAGTEVSPALVLAVIAVESGGRSDAVSSAGAGGLMQLMPATAKRFGVTDRTSASENIKGGVAYLNWLMKEFNNDPILVLAGYNAGENAVKKHKGVPPYSETRDYVPKVLAAFRTARGLCATPPELITDGCVFSIKSKN